MKFKVDENLPIEVAQLFKDAGFEADTVYDEGMMGDSDSSIFNVCRQKGMILVTLDLGFSDIRSYPPHTHPGIIILKLKSQSKTKIVQNVKKIISVIGEEQIQGCLWIVEEKRIKIRGLIESSEKN